ncbi:hypothetical protein [Paenibacillus sp. JDR-2]|uniref:hypothetical protein n=1 Tax=Paenibacillus sp. (strain JDR-2) TaxID=324057 RepID=UPI0001665925|nr:hypothetical protein [Paenibacillus sp. JDR-2]ACT01832.1 hypothetical protein Pjdr2_3190 [Paenibacillus sp. JDR-2]
MKLLEAVKNKKITGTILASALVIGSFGTITAFAANGSDAIPKNTVITATAPTDSSVVSDIPQGTIEYSKDTYSRTDGSQDFTMEHWYDPQTKDFRSDLMEYSSDHQLLRYQSTYYLNGFNELVVIQRDKDGNPLSAKTLKRSDDPSAFEKLDQKNLAFSGVKDNYKASYWTSVGTEQAADGKTLNKIMDSYQSYIDDNTQANMQYVVYLDQESGFPAKEELYEDSTGTFKLFSSDTNEYKYVANDGSIFHADGVTLTPVRTGAEAFAK